MLNAHRSFPSLTLLPIINLLGATYKGYYKSTFLILAIIALFAFVPVVPQWYCVQTIEQRINGTKCKLSGKELFVVQGTTDQL